MKSYAEKFGKFSKQKATKAAKTPFGNPPEEQSLFSLLSSVSATADYLDVTDWERSGGDSLNRR